MQTPPTVKIIGGGLAGSEAAYQLLKRGYAVEMYEDPILCDSIYDINGKKVGYLAYSSFDLASIPQLVEISKKFKAEGVKELILDLRCLERYRT